MKIKIEQAASFNAYLVTEQDVIKEVYMVKIEAPEDKIVQLVLDAIDWMVISDLSRLNDYSEKECEQILQCIANTVKNHLGGKLLFEVPVQYKKLVEQYLGISDKPVYPKGFEFFGRLMAAKGQNEVLVNKFQTYLERFNQLETAYAIKSKYHELLPMADKASRLLIDNASWAGDVPSDRQTYGQEAMKHRFTNPHVKCYAALNQNNGQLDGFVRVFRRGNTYYVGDLVVRKEKRKQGIAFKLLKKALSKIPCSGRIILIAGDDELVKLYSKLGFEVIANKDEATSFDNGNIFMSGLLPKGYLISDYHQSFDIPQSPKLAHLLNKTLREHPMPSNMRSVKLT